MNLDIRHHLGPATLMAYSAGTLGEALSAVASAHIEMCAVCRTELRDLDMVGGMLLEGLSIRSDGHERMPELPASSSVVALQPRRKPSASLSGRADRPEQFAKRAGIDLADVPWRRLGPGVWHYRLPLSPGAKGDLRLLKIAAGKQMPIHAHGGTELTLLLEGAYHDETGRYCGGDIQDIDGEDEHRPVADATTGCVCIIASEQPARYKSLVNRMLQPLTGI